jgi:hypothetical protein
MSLGFRSEVHYDAKKDTTFLTSDSPDFSSQLRVDFARGSEQDTGVRSLLEDQGEVSFVRDTVRLSTIGRAGQFGVLSDGTESECTYDNIKNLFLIGKEGSGILNLVRNYLLRAVVNQAKVYAVNAPQDFYGAEEYFDMDGDVVLVNSDTYTDWTDLKEWIEVDLDTGDEVLLLVHQNKAWDELSSEAKRFFSTLEGHRNLRMLTFTTEVHYSDLLSDDSVGYQYWFIGSTADLDERVSGFIGSLEKPVVDYIMHDRTDIPHQNPRGVLWLSRDEDDYERIVTYLVPRTMWNVAIQ